MSLSTLAQLAVNSLGTFSSYPRSISKANTSDSKLLAILGYLADDRYGRADRNSRDFIDFSTGPSLNSSMHSGRPDFGWPLE
jgi:hypothetical protein